MPETRRMTIQEWLETKAADAIRYCITEDQAFYNPETGMCDARNQFCAYRLPDGRCRKHGQKKTGDTAVIRKIEQELPQAEPAHTTEQCYAGGKHYFRKGFCIAPECKFQTNAKIPVQTKQGWKNLPKCVAHSIEGCMDGDKSLYNDSEPICCLATGKVECPYQVRELPLTFLEVNVVYCSRHENAQQV